jgi:hypothetical protein
MMVVVLGDKETEINDRHGLAKPRVQRSARQLVWPHFREPVDDSAADGAEARENV